MFSRLRGEWIPLKTPLKKKVKVIVIILMIMTINLITVIIMKTSALTVEE